MPGPLAAQSKGWPRAEARLETISTNPGHLQLGRPGFSDMPEPICAQLMRLTSTLAVLTPGSIDEIPEVGSREQHANDTSQNGQQLSCRTFQAFFDLRPAIEYKVQFQSDEFQLRSTMNVSWP